MDAWRDMSAEVLIHTLHGRTPVGEGAAAGSPGYDRFTAEGQRVMDRLASVFAEAVGLTPIDDTEDYLSEVDLESDEVPCSEDDIDTLIEQGIGLPDQPDDDGIPSPLSGPMWDLGHTARRDGATNARRIPWANRWDGALVESSSAVNASEPIGRRFLEEFRAACVAGFHDTGAMLLRALEIHTEWIDARASFMNPVDIPYSSHGRAINIDPASCPEDVCTLLARLKDASPAYFWYVRASVIVGCGPEDRVPAMDMAILCSQAAIFFVVASYAPWSERRQNYRGTPRLGAPFALGILGRLMTSVLATSGIAFNIFLLDILCSFPGVELSLLNCFHTITLVTNMCVCARVFTSKRIHSKNFRQRYV